MKNEPVEILLVEDNPGDVRLTVEALRDARVTNRVTVARDGVEAIEAVRRNAPRPDLILLDLNIPKLDGFSVLARLKNDEACRRIPVIVLTSSKAQQDVLKSYDLHANCFITKPINFSNYTEVVRSIEDFWFFVVQLPHK